MKSTFKNIDEEKQQRVVDAAIEEFAAYGFREASTNRLVKKLGISKGSLFKYFESKLDLYLYIVDITIEHLLSYMTTFKPLEVNDPIDNLIAYVEWEFDYLIENPIMYRFFYQIQKDMNLPELVEVREKLVRIALEIHEVILTDFCIPNNKDLRNHLTLILSAYNRLFMDNVDADANWASLKESYISGIKTHLSFVKWRI